MDRQVTVQTEITDSVVDVRDGAARGETANPTGSLSSFNANMSTCRYSGNDHKPKPIASTGVPLKHYGRRMKLNCRHGYNILIFPDGTVCTSDDDADNHCILEFTSMSPGRVRIKGVEANLFLAMDKNGRLYGEPDPSQNSTIFIEQPDGPFSAYLSLKYRRKKWYVAIKKNGQFKLGPDTKRGQHATHFLTIMV